MNKFYAEGKNGKLLVCVLEPGNIHKLTKERLPIEFSLNEGPYKDSLPPELSVAIFYSETPVADAREFAKMLAPGHTMEDKRTPVILNKRPHCPECKSTVEQLMVMRQGLAPWLVCCPMCGYVLGAVPPIPGMEAEKI